MEPTGRKVDIASLALSSDELKQEILNETGASVAATAGQQKPQSQRDAAETPAEASVQKAAEFFDETLVSAAALPLRSAKRKGGRPRLLTDEVRRQIALLLSVGLSRRRAAERVGVSHTTISQAAKNDPDFAAELERAEDLAGAERNLHIAALSRRSWKAAAWLVAHHQKYSTPESKQRNGFKTPSGSPGG